MTLATEDLIDRLAVLKRSGEPFVLATVVRTQNATAATAGAKALIHRDGSMQGWIGGGCTAGAVRKAAAQALGDGQARLVRVRPVAEIGQGDVAGVQEMKSACPSGGTVEVFVEPMLPRPTLLVMGASASARALCDLGRRSGFRIALAALAEDQAEIADVDARFEGFDLDGQLGSAADFVVVATQGKRDREALEAALKSGASYVAFVGSRRKAAALKVRLRERGLHETELARLHSPAGLDIGAVTPEELALSILAEIVQERRRGGVGVPDAPQVEVTEAGTVETEVVSPLAKACCGEGTDA
ncbi:MAG: XdhC family protein [Kiloniellales bacterium]|nr:XdhC family protein [Kiloniellales bacterium]